MIQPSEHEMWCLVLSNILLGFLLSGISGSKIDQSRQGLHSIPHIGQHVTEARFSKNNISEVLRITFSDANSLKVMSRIFTCMVKYIKSNKYDRTISICLHIRHHLNITKVFIIWYLVMNSTLYAVVSAFDTEHFSENDYIINKLKQHFTPWNVIRR